MEEEIHVPKETVAHILNSYFNVPSKADLKIEDYIRIPVTRDWNFKSSFELWTNIIYSGVKKTYMDKLPENILIKKRTNGSRERYLREKQIGSFSEKYKWPVENNDKSRIFTEYYNVRESNDEDVRSYLKWLDENQILIMAYEGSALDTIIFGYESTINRYIKTIKEVIESKGDPESKSDLIDDLSSRKFTFKEKLEDLLKSGLTSVARFHTLAIANRKDLPNLEEPGEDFYSNKLMGYITWIASDSQGNPFVWKHDQEKRFKEALSGVIKPYFSRNDKKGLMGIIHGDLNPTNLVLTNNTIKLIDGESVKIAPIAFDVAYFLINNVVKRPISEIEKLTEYYLKEKQLCEQELGVKSNGLNDQAFTYAVFLCGLYGSIRSAATAARTRKERPAAYYSLIASPQGAIYKSAIGDNMANFTEISKFLISNYRKYGLPDSVRSSLEGIIGILTNEVPILKKIESSSVDIGNGPINLDKGVTNLHNNEPKKRGLISRIPSSLMRALGLL